MKKICIIKFGALGDVLRTTSLLRKLKEKPCEITWVTGPGSKWIIQNSLIDYPVVYSHRLELGPFDFLYNFDEEKEACQLAEEIEATVKKGYGWKGNAFVPFDESSAYAYEMTQNDELKFKKNKKTYQQIIFEVAGEIYKGEEYVLENIEPRSVQVDIGLNYMVSPKFPLKTWPLWEAFASAYQEKATISVQKIFPSIQGYIDWISGCDTIITTDSLGMHLAIALKKRVIALFGNTSSEEIDLYGRGVKITEKLPCSPCYKKTCLFPSVECMEQITPEKVWKVYSENK